MLVFNDMNRGFPEMKSFDLRSHKHFPEANHQRAANGTKCRFQIEIQVLVSVERHLRSQISRKFHIK